MNNYPLFWQLDLPSAATLQTSTAKQGYYSPFHIHASLHGDTAHPLSISDVFTRCEKAPDVPPCPPNRHPDGPDHCPPLLKHGWENTSAVAASFPRHRCKGKIPAVQKALLRGHDCGAGVSFELCTRVRH
ncbi:hypothetical protein GN956_G10744 [Arapaima gigas]